MRCHSPSSFHPAFQLLSHTADFPELRVAVCLHGQHPEVTSVYDDVGNLRGGEGSDSEVLTGIRTALDGGRQEFKQTLRGHRELHRKLPVVDSSVLSDKEVRNFYMSRVGSKVDHEHGAGAAAKGTLPPAAG
jgi:hypothetical protein